MRAVGKTVETAAVEIIWTGRVEEHFGTDRAELFLRTDLDETIVGGDAWVLGPAEGNN
jgi:hypothetical protein